MVGHIALAPFGFDKLVSGIGCGPAICATDPESPRAFREVFGPSKRPFRFFPPFPADPPFKSLIQNALNVSGLLKTLMFGQASPL